MLKRLRNIFGSTPNDDKFKKKKYTSLLNERSPLQEWKLVKELGDGAFGKVYQAYSEQLKQYAAAKVIDECPEDELAEHTVEIDILHECQHENIIKFYDAYYHDQKLYIFLEYCYFGAVDNIMTTLDHALNEQQIRFIAHELLEALHYLHNVKFVIHRDIKASNVLLTEDGRVKLADFGVSVKNSSLNETRNEYIGTVYWMSPEVFFCEANTSNTYDYRVDIWSFAITLIEMAEMDPPHHEMKAERVGAKIRQGEPPTLSEIKKWSAEFSNILSCCLKRDPNQRLTTTELKQHPFVINSKTNQPVLYLLEEYKAVPIVDVVEEDVIDTKTNQQPTSSKLPLNETTNHHRSSTTSIDDSLKQFTGPNDELMDGEDDEDDLDDDEEMGANLAIAIDGNENTNGDANENGDGIVLTKIRRLSSTEPIPDEVTKGKENEKKPPKVAVQSTTSNLSTKPPPVPTSISSMKSNNNNSFIPVAPPLPAHLQSPPTKLNSSFTPSNGDQQQQKPNLKRESMIITTQFPTKQRSPSETKPSIPKSSLPPATNKLPAPTIQQTKIPAKIVTPPSPIQVKLPTPPPLLSSMDKNPSVGVTTVRINGNERQPSPRIEVGRLNMEDVKPTDRELDDICQVYVNSLIEEVIQSDFEKPSIPEVILAVITDLTNDETDVDVDYPDYLSHQPATSSLAVSSYPTPPSSSSTMLYDQRRSRSIDIQHHLQIQPQAQLPHFENNVNSNSHNSVYNFSTIAAKARSVSPSTSRQLVLNYQQNGGTNGNPDYYNKVHRSTNNNGAGGHDSLRSTSSNQSQDSSDTASYRQTRATRRRTIRTTRRFVVDGKEEEIVTTKIVEPHNDYARRLTERKEANREFRRLYHLEEKRRQQLLTRHEYEIEEQKQEFRRKREDLCKKYDFELQTMEQKQKAEIEREMLLLTNEYNKKMKTIKLDNDKELKQFREQLREQLKQIRRDYETASQQQQPSYHHQTYNGAMSVNMIGHTNGNQSLTMKDRKDQIKRYLTEKEDEFYMKEKQYQDNQQTQLEQQLKTIENYHKQRIQALERQFLTERQNLLKTKEQALWEVDEVELRSRYDLLRKQTKAFYSLFRTMLNQQAEKELQQLDEQGRFDRDNLEQKLQEDKRQWPRIWKKMQKTRMKQFKQQLLINKTSFEDEKILLKKFENDENEKRRVHEERLKGKHRHSVQNLIAKHQITRNELLTVQRQKLEQCVDFETRKLQELQSTFECDWVEFRNTQKSRKLIDQFNKNLQNVENALHAFWLSPSSRGNHRSSSPSDSIYDYFSDMNTNKTSVHQQINRPSHSPLPSSYFDQDNYFRDYIKKLEHEQQESKHQTFVYNADETSLNVLLDPNFRPLTTNEQKQVQQTSNVYQNYPQSFPQRSLSYQNLYCQFPDQKRTSPFTVDNHTRAYSLSGQNRASFDPSTDLPQISSYSYYATLPRGDPSSSRHKSTLFSSSMGGRNAVQNGLNTISVFDFRLNKLNNIQPGQYRYSSSSILSNNDISKTTYYRKISPLTVPINKSFVELQYQQQKQSPAPVILRSTPGLLQSWHSWPGVDLVDDIQFHDISDKSESILF
ncbi:unnamed protein product [Didymodactylos carnosus]|uniref:Protein kinase domain-containing protein n=1 Tax=Didymodactylos carnosus TaxID=1234261 RepID=A0A8S2HPP6_9BILA|nr:unnamed protein product [Didymodactylos carnosus]CAF3653765.1 unnamed protein product [Didymodactylos carnosus]